MPSRETHFRFYLPDPEAVNQGLTCPNVCAKYKQIEEELNSGSWTRPQKVFTQLLKAFHEGRSHGDTESNKSIGVATGQGETEGLREGFSEDWQELFSLSVDVLRKLNHELAQAMAAKALYDFHFDDDQEEAASLALTFTDLQEFYEEMQRNSFTSDGPRWEKPKREELLVTFGTILKHVRPEGEESDDSSESISEEGAEENTVVSNS
ncbi:hypothetical protein TREMEDRAFT_59613 [Tremella mesenterica DSM 1558]|uniref:uncharacterized protein n=1 Tax=Tremella mesenterica (strain ATCC 24925 / CBS 8224 / DSM 1558 / NBRC 9311 / NRRL Y-6157 / RJB 2259-6 / UBC 559-6) TaxID=578456 RepID=UPI0003F49AD7|nr:uncharacterized protein TREMEDRAFT_59613 [Tremella mesenterica DSM 1558]EIW73444.1 hypothetical protein TREMEDRAFT_59613 [Tremella mesenterica DSM 1558]